MKETCMALDADRRWEGEEEEVVAVVAVVAVEAVDNGSDIEAVDVGDPADMNEGFGGTVGGGGWNRKEVLSDLSVNGLGSVGADCSMSCPPFIAEEGAGDVVEAVFSSTAG